VGDLGRDPFVGVVLERERRDPAANDGISESGI
jgi:hypothetical protein